jgi:hypothetical protein
MMQVTKGHKCFTVFDCAPQTTSSKSVRGQSSKRENSLRPVPQSRNRGIIEMRTPSQRKWHNNCRLLLVLV